MLLAVDDFFRQLGLAEIRLRSSRDDKPLRMVKTLLHELCKKKVLPGSTALTDHARRSLTRPGQASAHRLPAAKLDSRANWWRQRCTHPPERRARRAGHAHP